MLGPNYFIFNDHFLKCKKVKISHSVKKVFISMGGLDSKEMTEKFLKILENEKFDLEYIIVLKSISDERRKNILNILKNNFKKSQLIINPKNIAKIISSCDIGIINSGLIKYETSFLGLPSIIISNDDKHEI